MSAKLTLHEKILAGDKQAFVEFLSQRVLPLFRRRILKRSGGMQEADLEDLQQDLFHRLLKWYATCVSLPKTPTALLAFALVVGGNLFVDRVRHDAVRQQDQGESALHLIETNGLQDFAWSCLMAALRDPPPGGAKPGVERRYGVFVDLIEEQQAWPSTRVLALRLGVSSSQASKLKAAMQTLLRSRLEI